MLYEITSGNTELYPTMPWGFLRDIETATVFDSSRREMRGAPEKLIPDFREYGLMFWLHIDTSSRHPSLESGTETFLTRELIEKKEKIKALEAVSGILSDLTPAQMEIFEASVKRRPLFK